MIYGDVELREMVRVLGTAISRIVSGERSLELFGVGEDGDPAEAVLMIIHGDDWPQVSRLLMAIYDIANGGYERHDFGTPDDN